MNKLCSPFVLAMTALLVIASGSIALAAGIPATAIVNERVFNDCPISILTVDNTYPAYIAITDEKNGCVSGFANRHNWRFSDDGASNKLFANGDGMRIFTIMTITGTGEGEAGIGISPWWSKNVDGVFNVRTTDGEIACFGGRLPFYSFTGSHGVNYTKGEPIFLEINYLPNGLNVLSPGTIEYSIEYLGSHYTSGPLAFDEGNPAEDPPYGVWGILNEATAGGFMQFFIGSGPADADMAVRWEEIMFEDLGGPVAVEDSSWGDLKALFR